MLRVIFIWKAKALYLLSRLRSMPRRSRSRPTAKMWCWKPPKIISANLRARGSLLPKLGTRNIASIDHQRCAGDAGGFVAAQKRRRATHVFRVEHRAARHALQSPAQMRLGVGRMAGMVAQHGRIGD